MFIKFYSICLTYLSIFTTNVILKDNHLTLTTIRAEFQINHRTAVYEILLDILSKHNFETIYLKTSSTCSLCKLIGNLTIPVIIDDLRTSSQIKPTINSNLIAIVFWNKNLSISTLNLLVQTLHSMRETKTMIYVSTASEKYSFKLVENILSFFYNHKMFNVFAFIGDSSYKSEFYTLWAYPNFHIVKESVSALADYFPNKFKNLHGTSIITLPDQLEPRTIVHRNKLGQQVLTGYVGKLMLTLAWKLNATLKYARPVKGGEIIFYGDLLASTKNGTLICQPVFYPLQM
ncbi:uncharacterized protein LOC119674215 [Teleopsis dalmanni]|uniref:uncharacterized protein LOC119674215 n=1 Tax=Teleopsis dalmanni TaxID=139649 RepID=UPI0018CF89E3|nr:uncharacterized protein LOC119674215 [Teleopsis dalmanni]